MAPKISESGRLTKSSKAVIVLCGGSNVGKTHLSEQVLRREYDAFICKIDAIYAQLVNEIGMVPGPAGAKGRRKLERAARARARDKRWKDADEERAFMSGYERRVRDALSLASPHRLAVVEGGTLSRVDEMEMVVKAVREQFDADAPIYRINIRVPYQRWLVQRVERKWRAKRPTLKVAALTRAQHKIEMKVSRPRPYPGVQDFAIKSAHDLRELLRAWGINRASWVEKAARLLKAARFSFRPR